MRGLGVNSGFTFHTFVTLHKLLSLSFPICEVGWCYILQETWKKTEGNTFRKDPASLVPKTVRNPPAVQETWTWTLDQEDPWRREWQPTQVSLPGESHGQRSLVGYIPWGGKELDTTERLSMGCFMRNAKYINTGVYSNHISFCCLHFAPL